MGAEDRKKDYEHVRLIHRILVNHYIEGRKQADIAKDTNTSPSKVNRLIALGHKLGMVKIDIESPFQALVDMEEKLRKVSGLGDTVITPSVSGNIETTLAQVGGAAANMLVENLRDGHIIAISAGRAVSAVVESLQPERSFDVTVVPMTGGIQGHYHTDVNHLASQMAERLGGRALQLHAPLFAESVEQKKMLMSVASIRDVLDVARRANISLAGVGSFEPSGSSYYDLNTVTESDRNELVEMGVVGEFLAHLIQQDGTVAGYKMNSRLVALSPTELVNCSKVIGVAAGKQKVLPIQAVLNSKILNSLVLDEETAAAVIQKMESSHDVTRYA